MAKPIPDGYHSLTPSLIVSDGKKAVEFYKKAFGAKDHGVMMCPDTGRFMHAELEIDGSRFMLGGEMQEMGCFSPLHYKGTPVSMYLYVKDSDKAFDQAVKAGATSIMPVGDMFWGDRCGTVKDPFGHQWSIGTHKEDLTPQQIQEGAKKWMEQAKKKAVAA